MQSSLHGCSRARTYGLMRSESCRDSARAPLAKSTGAAANFLLGRVAWTASSSASRLPDYNTPQSRGQYWCEGRGQHATSSHYRAQGPTFADIECLLVSHSILVAARRKYRAFSVLGNTKPLMYVSKSPTVAFDTPNTSIPGCWESGPWLLYLAY